LQAGGHELSQVIDVFFDRLETGVAVGDVSEHSHSRLPLQRVGADSAGRYEPEHNGEDLGVRHLACEVVQHVEGTLHWVVVLVFEATLVFSADLEAATHDAL